MPHKTGRGTYKGYESPETGGWPEPIRDEVRRVYGAWRSKHPGEDPATKARGARIAWSIAKKKYPNLYRYHIKDSRRLSKETQQEMKEHPWAGKKTAKRIATDHMRKTRIADLHAAARQERRWAQTARNEQVSESRRSKMKARQGKFVEASDLKRDAKIAGDFAKWRMREARKMDMEATRLTRPVGRYVPISGRRNISIRSHRQFGRMRKLSQRRQEPGLLSQYFKHRRDVRKAEMMKRESESRKGKGQSIGTQIEKSSFDSSFSGQVKRERMEQSRKESESLRAQGEARFKAEQEAKLNQAALQKERESTVTGD